MNASDELEESCTNLCFSPDGSWLACGFANGVLRLWKEPDLEKIRMDSPHQTIQVHTRGFWSIDFSPDSRYLASTAWVGDETVQIIDLSAVEANDSTKSRLVLRARKMDSGSVAFHPGQNIVATCDRDAIIRLWSTVNWQSLKTLRVDRPYERTDITGVTGLTKGQLDSMKALGAVVRG